MKMKTIMTSMIILSSSSAALALAAQAQDQISNVLNDALTFLYQMAHLIGIWIVGALQHIFPKPIPANMVDPIGVLTLFTAVLILMELTKKLGWVLIVLGWIAIAAHFVLLLVQG
jgi:uncharacterized phage infection (PIP) family protein YhgE